MRIRTFLKPLSFLPAIFLMYLIFSFSSMEADVSTNISYKASVVLVKAADSLFDMGLDDYQISYFATKIHGVTRKLAHMTEFFALAIAVSFPLYVYGLRGILLMILAGGFCIAFACGDEYHQSFVAGRSPSSKDVAIDSIGVFIGILAVRIIGWTGRMTLFRPLKSKNDIPQMQAAPTLSKKEQKQWKKQQKAMRKAGYDPDQFSGFPNSYPDGAFQNGGLANNPYPNDGYPNGGFSNVPYSDGPYQNGSFQNEPYPNGPYPNGSFQNEPYPYGSFPNASYPNGPYPNGNFSPYPPQYDSQDKDDEYSSDELSEDMPFSHLLKHKK